MAANLVPDTEEMTSETEAPTNTNGHQNGATPNGATPSATKPVQNGNVDPYAIFPSQRLAPDEGDYVVVEIQAGKAGGLSKFVARTGLLSKTVLVRPAGKWLTIGQLALVEVTENHDRFCWAEVRHLIDENFSLAAAWEMVKGKLGENTPRLSKIVDQFVSGVPLTMAEVTPWVEWQPRPVVEGHTVVFQIPEKDFGNFLGKNHDHYVELANAFAWLGYQVRCAHPESLNAKRVADLAAYRRMHPIGRVWFPDLIRAQELLPAFLKEEEEKQEAARKAAELQAKLAAEAAARGTSQRYKGKGARARAAQTS